MLKSLDIVSHFKIATSWNIVRVMSQIIGLALSNWYGKPGVHSAMLATQVYTHISNFLNNNQRTLYQAQLF